MSKTRPLPEQTQGLGKRLKHFKRKHLYANAFEARGYDDMADKLRDCEETEILACCSGCGKSWYIKNFCRLRVCPLCSFRVSRERAKFMEYMCKDMAHPKMITLTLPTWTKVPQDGIKYLRECFNKLRRTTLFKKVVGGAYQIELKSKADGWHIHMHILLDCPFIPYQRLFSEWKTITKVKAPQIDVRSADSEKARAYMCKYASKSADFEGHFENVVDWYEAVKGQRLFTTFGNWYNVKMEDVLEEDADERPPPLLSTLWCREAHLLGT